MLDNESHPILPTQQLLGSALRNPESGKLISPSKLVGTKYLPALEDVSWDDLSKNNQIAIKRARLGVQILKKSSDETSKYDLFQRLNSGGSIATPQEIRNCVVVMISPPFFELMKELGSDKSFLSLLHLTKEARQQQRELDFVTRYLVHLYVEYEKRIDIQDFLDEGVIELASDKDEDYSGIRDNFMETFELIRRAAGKDALKRFVSGKFTGNVGLRAFETIAIGVGTNLGKIKKLNDPASFVVKKIRTLWQQPEIKGFAAAGLRGTDRIRKTVPFGEKWFKPGA